jgi:hypothetical protein
MGPMYTRFKSAEDRPDRASNPPNRRPWGVARTFSMPRSIPWRPRAARGGLALILGAWIGGLSVPEARAGSLTMTTQLGPAVGQGNFGNLLDVSILLDGQATGVYAGPIRASLGGGKSFDAYCVDIDHDNYFSGSGQGPSYQVTPTPISQLPGGHGVEVAYLYDRFATRVHDGQPDDVIRGAALQVAIWTAEYTNRVAILDAPTGPQHEVYEWVQTYLDSFSRYHGQPAQAAWLDSVNHPANPYNPSGNGLNQNLLGPRRYLPSPEPSTFLLATLAALSGLGCVWARARG